MINYKEINKFYPFQSKLIENKKKLIVKFLSLTQEHNNTNLAAKKICAYDVRLTTQIRALRN